jgi:hemerythrin-like domain-containing protein
MPVQIGQTPDRDFTEPIGLLTDCHRRIERFLSVIEKLATEVHGARLSPEQRLSLSGALQYFRDAAPKHTADEELSLFPRLRAAGGTDVAAALAEIDRLENDHVRADRLHREVDDLGGAWLRNGTLPAESSQRLRQLAERLATMSSAHIELEDQRVFPLAERILGPEEKQAIGREMAIRRRIAVESIA